ncbi:uncharacterized protein PG986_013183 [Apiospora aurea]|uniref:Uncharacterized protein n=1 Tax=Apiospora aurea TaxID=335848 RepID=A0ABR1PUV2_9PEZI
MEWFFGRIGEQQESDLLIMLLVLQLFSSRKSKWQIQKPPPGFARHEGGWYVKPVNKDPGSFKKAKSRREMRGLGWFNDNKGGGGDALG